MDKTWAEEAYDIEGVLPAVLADLIRPAPTAIVATRLARATEITQDRVAKHLLKMAHSHPNATHNGEEKMRFGRRVTGWLWHPTEQHEGSIKPALELQSAAAPSALQEAWTVAPKAPDLPPWKPHRTNPAMLECHSCWGSHLIAEFAAGVCPFCGVNEFGVLTV